MSRSRRTFLQQVSSIAALGVLDRRPGRQLWAVAPSKVYPELDESVLRGLALTAMEAARAAGASFADIRLTAARHYRLGVRYERARGDAPWVQPPALTFSLEYAVRAIVAGAWGFVNGTELTPDGVTGTARAAVEAARGFRPRHRRSLELAPAPRVTDGRWATPIQQDPFAVPLGEQRELAFATLTEAAQLGAVVDGQVNFGWRDATVVFASTEGTLLVQRITQRGEGGASVNVRTGPNPTDTVYGGVDIPGGGYGYEVMRPATLPADLREAAERALRRGRTPRRYTAAEVGRYDLVLGAGPVAEYLAATVGEALNLERALGFRANWDGTSFAAPPASMLGQYQMASKHVTLRADRSQPHGAATVGWDGEGVPPDEHTLLQDGVVMDYHTNRQTAVELADWYRARGEGVRSHGCTRRTGGRRPIVRVPNLTLVPGPGATTVEDLIADTRRGFYIEYGGGGFPDQQVLSVQTGASGVRKITNGKLGDYVHDFAVQFVTPQFWRSVDALGGAAAARRIRVYTDPWMRGDLAQPFPASTVQAVPVRVRQVNVLNTGRTP